MQIILDQAGRQKKEGEWEDGLFFKPVIAWAFFLDLSLPSCTAPKTAGMMKGLLLLAG